MGQNATYAQVNLDVIINYVIGIRLSVTRRSGLFLGAFLVFSSGIYPSLDISI